MIDVFYVTGTKSKAQDASPRIDLGKFFNEESASSFVSRIKGHWGNVLIDKREESEADQHPEHKGVFAAPVVREPGLAHEAVVNTPGMNFE